MQDDSAGIICASDISQLLDLFLQFEGAIDPLSKACQEAERTFDALVERLHADKVLPDPQFKTVNLVQFRGHVRVKCRQLASKSIRQYSCF